MEAGKLGYRRGRFGWFESVDDQRVADRLLGQARDWLQAEGCSEIAGPYGFTDLDPEGLLSCERTEGCEGCGASAVYVGTIDAGQEGYLFGAGCLPAVLNPTGEPDLTPAPCTLSAAATISTSDFE